MRRFIPTVALATFTLIAVACSSGAASSPPLSGSSGPSASPSFQARPITSPEEAAARVKEVAPHLEGIGPKNPDLIGGCCFWEATPTADGWDVVFEVGWGDCQSGCIDRHRWTYHVTRDGAVTLISENGPPPPSGVPGSGGGTTGGILPGGDGIQGRALAGPTCPVVTANDPNCNDRPIAGATVLVLDAAGTEVARLVTDSAGHYLVTLPSGPYSIEPQPVEGIMRNAGPVAVTVADGYVTVDLQYDTGIR
jgi:hypothetical protein